MAKTEWKRGHWQVAALACAACLGVIYVVLVLLTSYPRIAHTHTISTLLRLCVCVRVCVCMCVCLCDFGGLAVLLDMIGFRDLCLGTQGLGRRGLALLLDGRGVRV